MTALDDYESAQVCEISLWKSERPSHLMESYRGLSRPFSRLVARVVPKGLAREALGKVEALAREHDTVADLLREAGTSRVGEFLGRPLEECDRLASRACVRAEHLAILEGVAPAVVGVAVPGVGGTLASTLDVPFLLQAALRAVRRVGHCYGFPLDSEPDRRFVLAILDLANQDGPAGPEQDRLGLWSPDGPPERKPDGSAAGDGVERGVIDDLPLESVPIAGDVANLVLDYAFVRRADVTARRVFQERWLRSNGKVESIPPSPDVRRRGSLDGVADVTAELAYAGAYGVSFGATFAATLAGSLVRSVAPGSVRRGVAEGASAATRDSRRLLDGLGRPVGSPSGPRPGGVPAIA